MDDRERQQAELLERYHAALIADPAAMPPEGLAPDLARTARRLALGLRVAEPERAFVATLHDRLGFALPARMPNGHAPIPARHWPILRLSPTTPTRPRPAARRRGPWWTFLAGANVAATVALIVAIALASAFLLRGLGHRSSASVVGATPTGTPRTSSCVGTLAPVTYATPSGRVINATPTGREAEMFIPCVFEQDDGLRRAEDAGLIQRPNISQAVNGYTLTIERVYVEPSRMVLGYTVRTSEGSGADISLHGSRLTVTDGAGRTYGPSTGPRLENGGPGPGGERFFSTIATVDMSGLSADTRQTTFTLAFAEISATHIGPAAIPVKNAGGTVTGSVVQSSPQPQQVATAGPWSFTLTLPVAPARVAEVNQTFTSPITASYEQGGAALIECARCPQAPAEGIAIRVDRVVVTPSEARVTLRLTPPSDGASTRWEVRDIAIADPRSRPEQNTLNRWGGPPEPGGDVYIVTFSNPLYEKPGGEWTLTVGELFTVLPPAPGDTRGGILVHLRGHWEFHFVMP